MVEPDIDYYKDLGAHAIYEVVPNAITHSLTDPTDVYVLRWMAGHQAGVPELTLCARSRPDRDDRSSEMKRVRYSVAMSLDGFIAGPKGEYDWIVMDKDYDWKAHYGQFDTCIMGRKTYDTMRERGMSPKSMGMKAYVVSTTMRPEDHSDVIIVGEDVFSTIKAVKSGPGRDIWLFGGGMLFRCLLDAGLVDAIDVAVEPVLLGSGTPLLPEGQRAKLKLTESKAHASGIVTLKYDVL
jgi:dihydrofolate reductase